MKPIIFLIMISMIFGSCNLFSKKDKEDAEKQFLKYKLSREIEETKNFNYLSELISYEKNISKDTVQVVLKEYYKTFEAYTFNENINRLQENYNHYGEKESHKIDFINSLEKKYKINRKSLYLITYQIDDYFFKEENLNNIESLTYEIEDLNDKFNKD
ncbi:hypothetical protein [Flavobacterium macrobrachii]|jgi:hypothetical protein|uniref:hypothetical protein n=1 Tax=Flavobacterium macrobrachii TaxID=591204 RepID=UPI0037BF0D91